jgi:serine/threonine protein kinase
MVGSDGRLTAVKSVADPQLVNDHCWITPLNHDPAITTEFAVNGSLRNHLCDDKDPVFSLLKHPTKIAKIITGIALAMRYVHSKGVIHRNLTPDNILLDWNWNVRIADFGCSTFTDTSRISPGAGSGGIPRGDTHYLAPECYDNVDDPANDVFSFSLIVYELIVGKPAFSKGMNANEVAGVMVKEKWQLDIPDSVLPETAELIHDCCAPNYRERLCFSGILDRLEEMRFKLIRRVNSSKLTAFVKEIQEQEASNQPQ